MIRSNNRYAENAFDALTSSSEIIVIGGNPRQIFSPVPSPGTFEDDRRMVPCILYGHVSCADPAGLMNGMVALSGIEWYTQKPIEGDYTTGRINNPASIPSEASQYREIDYLISDGSSAAWCENTPKDALIIHKNVATNSGMTIYAYLKFTDLRTGLLVRILKSCDLSTSGFDNEATVLTGPGTAEIMIDALAIPDSVPAGQTIVDIPWMRRVDAQLVGAEGNVPDAQACYLWMTRSNSESQWREFSEDERIFLSLSGIQTRELSFDARMIEGTREFRCVACRRHDGDTWKSPLLEAERPFYDCRITQNMNNHITADPVQKKGSATDITMRTPFAYAMDIRYNGKPVPVNKLELFRIHWKAKGPITRNGTTSYVETDLGYAPNMQFTPADYGYTYAGGFMVWADVYTFNGCRPVVSGANYVISPTFV